MNAFVSLVLLAGSSLAAPAADPQVLVAAKPYINTGAASGPLTPAVGDLVATPNGYRSLALEGFSEDLNQDGFVDPIGQAVPVVHAVAAPVVQTVAAPAVAAVKAVVPAATVKTAPVVAAPAVAAYSVPVAHHVGYQVHHTVQHVPQVTVQKAVKTYTTHHVINHAPVVGAFTGLVPAVAPVAAGTSPVKAPTTGAWLMTWWVV